MLARIVRARDELMAAGLRPRLFGPVTAAVLGRLKSREISSTIQRLGFRSSEASAVLDLEGEAQKAVKILAGRKTAAPKDAYAFLEHTPPHLIVFLMAESSNAKVTNKVRNYLTKWRPLRHGLPSAAAELEALGVARGPKFNKVVEELFALQLAGKGRTPEDRTKLLRKLAGIKEEPKKKEEKKKSDDKLKKRLMGKEAKGKPSDAAAAASPAPPQSAAAHQQKIGAQRKPSAPVHAASKTAPKARSASKRRR
jgi:hypothetical protein